MRKMFLLLIAIGFIFQIHAYNPLAGNKLLLCYNLETDSLLTKEKHLINALIEKIFKNESEIVKVNHKKLNDILAYHYSYNKAAPIKHLVPEGTDNLIIVTYTRRIVYGLAGSYEHSFNVGGGYHYTGSGGMAFSSGFPFSINFTDENPEWQYYTKLFIDIYDTKSGRRLLTVVDGEESSSDSILDTATLYDNIEEIIEDITESIYEKKTWRNYQKISTQPLSSRDRSNVSKRVKYNFFKLFQDVPGEIERTNTNDTIVIKFLVGEYGDVLCVQVKERKEGEYRNILKFIKSINFGRTVKPNDSAWISTRIIFKQIYGKPTINDYYLETSGPRSNEMIWKILYNFTDELVKHTLLENCDNIYLAFTVDENGKVVAPKVMNGTTGAKKKSEEILEKVSEWNFGKENERITTPTNVKYIFNFKHKNKVKKRKR